MDGDVETVFNRWICNQELQAAIVLGLTCVGAWVMVTWVIQILFSIVWPFFVVLGLMICMPQWRRTITNDVFPKYSEAFRNLINRLLATYNNATVTTN